MAAKRAILKERASRNMTFTLCYCVCSMILFHTQSTSKYFTISGDRLCENLQLADFLVSPILFQSKVLLPPQLPKKLYLEMHGTK